MGCAYEFTSYDQWIDAGEADGYVLGKQWSNAYPGLTIPDAPSIAGEWVSRISRPFYECTIESDRFCPPHLS